MRSIKFIKSISIIILTLVLYSCHSGVPKRVQEALDLAGDNQKELEKVINHYQSPKDSLKLKAAYFLIENMANNYSIIGPQLEKFNTIFPKIEKARKEKAFVKDANSDSYLVVDSLWDDLSMKNGNLSRFNLKVKPDLYSIRSEFLIENIEYAFKAWNLPWSRHLSFKEFCEYILPYRFSDEAITSWRPLLFKYYKPLLDSLKGKNIEDPVKVCEIVNKKLSSKWLYSHTIAKYPVAMTVENLMRGNIGSCTHQTGFAIFTMRALGVPVVHEQIPHYGNRSLGHDFNGVLSKNGKFIDFEVGNVQMGNVLTTRKRWKYFVPKIYRQTYSSDAKLALVSKPENEEIPPYFRNPCVIDVTSQYLPVTTVKINLTKQIPSQCSHLYLCVFDNKNWQAVGFAKINNNHAVFKNIGKGFVYLPMYYVNNEFIPASSPVIVDEVGITTIISPISKEQNMLLKRKYIPAKHLKVLMKDGVFQASNSRDFKKKCDLYFIKDSLELIPQNIFIKNPRKFRYVRFLFPLKSKGNISEMSFFSKDSLPLKGKIITSENISKNGTIKKAFDGDVLSFVQIEVDTTKQQWIGLDFGFKREIEKLSFCTKTDKNDVWIGLNYELFYWDREWKSLGVKKAMTNQLEYKSPISNALFLLRCLNEGYEERIFTYENGKQVWW